MEEKSKKKFTQIDVKHKLLFDYFIYTPIFPLFLPRFWRTPPRMEDALREFRSIAAAPEVDPIVLAHSACLLLSGGPLEPSVRDAIVESNRNGALVQGLLAHLAVPDRDTAQVLALFGSLFRARGRLAEADELLARASVLDPENATVALALAHTRGDAQDLAGAAAAVTRCCTRDNLLQLPNGVLDALRRCSLGDQPGAGEWFPAGDPDGTGASSTTPASDESAPLSDNQVDWVALAGTAAKVWEGGIGLLFTSAPSPIVQAILSTSLTQILFQSGELAAARELCGVLGPLVSCHAQQLRNSPARNELAFLQCVSALLRWPSAASAIPPSAGAVDTVYLVGDSHCLVPAWRRMHIRGKVVTFYPRLCTGVKVGCVC